MTKIVRIEVDDLVINHQGNVSHSVEECWVAPGGGGGGTASLRVGTQNKTTDPRFCATTALSPYPC